MENIDISKIKNISNSLTDSEILELNSILNKDSVRSSLAQLYESEKEKRHKLFTKIQIIVIIAMIIAGIQFLMGQTDIVQIIINVTTICLVWGILLFIWYLLKAMINLGKSDDEDIVLLWWKQELIYEKKKKLLLQALWDSSRLKFAVPTEYIDHDEIIRSFRDRGIFETEYRRSELEDLLLVSHGNERLILGEWKAYVKSWKFGETLKFNKLFFVKKFIKPSIFSDRVSIEYKRTLWEKLSAKSNTIILGCAFIFFVFGFLYLLLTPEWKAIRWTGDGVEAFSGMFIWIFIFWYVFVSSLNFKRKSKKIELASSDFSKNFSIHSDDSQAKITFENPQVQQIFLDFLKNTNYQYNVYIENEEIVISRNIELDFLEFYYKNDINIFIKSFVDFYIEQKYVFQFLENIKILYK